jgi:hypothetical protein
MGDGLGGPRGRDQGLLWGIIAELCVAPVVYAWAGSSHDADRMVFGRPGSIAVLAAALVLTAGGAVASVMAWYGARDWSAGRRWTVAGPVVAVAIAVVVLGFGSMTSARAGGDVILGGLLFIGAAAMVAVAARVVRVRATASGDRLRARFEELRKDRT